MWPKGREGSTPSGRTTSLPKWWNGSPGGLKIPRSQERAGSSPVFGTEKDLDVLLEVRNLLACFRVINSGQLVQYIVVRNDLPRGFLAAQVAHAAGHYGPHPTEAHVVILAVPNEQALTETSARMSAAGIEHELIREPDEPWCNQATALGCNLTDDRTKVRKVVSQLPLLR